MSSQTDRWTRFQKYYFEFPEIQMAVDLSRIDFADDFFDSIAPRMERAFTAMAALEQGAIANPDEGRMVGHYWLRNPGGGAPPGLCTVNEKTNFPLQKISAAMYHGGLGGGRRA